jgi:hypothetical protein
MPATASTPSPRKAAYTVAETAALCNVSRSRFYDLIRSGAMPYPTFCVRTRRPLYPADLAALCQRVRETSVGFHGGYVLFYDRKRRPSQPPALAPEPHRAGRKAPVPDPLTQEMAETLKAMGVRSGEAEVLTAIGRQCPAGVSEATFESDLRAVFDALRCTDRA